MSAAVKSGDVRPSDANAGGLPAPTGEQLYAMVTGRFTSGSFPWAMVPDSGKAAWEAAASDLVFAPDTIAANLARPISSSAARLPDVSDMVSRFLGWSLPKTFGPDCGISFDGRKDDEWNKNKTWPIGTNLLTADEARAMFEHCLGGVA